MTAVKARIGHAEPAAGFIGIVHVPLTAHCEASSTGTKQPAVDSVGTVHARHCSVSEAASRHHHGVELTRCEGGALASCFAYLRCPTCSCFIAWCCFTVKLMCLYSALQAISTLCLLRFMHLSLCAGRRLAGRRHQHCASPPSDIAQHQSPSLLGQIWCLM